MASRRQSGNLDPQEWRVHGGAANATQELGERLLELWMLEALPQVVLCIGTDRSTGDALGPLVGSRLEGCGLPLVVRGTLDKPVHAENLEPTLHGLATGRPRILAVDACLGRPEAVGSIAIGRGRLRPGAGVNRKLPVVGDYYITATVNVGGFMEYAVLQNTRLATVMKLAAVIADGILWSVHRYTIAIPHGKVDGR